MSDYSGKFRTNYFVPRDMKETMAFLNPIQGIRIEVRGGMMAVIGNDCSIPDIMPPDHDDEMGTENRDLNFALELGELMAEGETLVIMEIGAEGMRYFLGLATAVHKPKGGGKCKETILNLDDIYQKARAEFGISEDEAISMVQY